MKGRTDALLLQSPAQPWRAHATLFGIKCRLDTGIELRTSLHPFRGRSAAPFAVAARRHT